MQTMQPEVPRKYATGRNQKQELIKKIGELEELLRKGGEELSKGYCISKM